jgi:hypothetical protein
LVLRIGFGTINASCFIEDTEFYVRSGPSPDILEAGAYVGRTRARQPLCPRHQTQDGRARSLAALHTTTQARRQYAATPRASKRHRVRNNLPGTREFCPLIRRTEKLDKFIAMNLSQAAVDHIVKTHADLLSRAAAFLLLKDSKASHTIEGETPHHNRIERWGKIIGEAGQRALSVNELEYLQSIVIADSRFITPGCRIEGGFIMSWLKKAARASLKSDGKKIEFETIGVT